MLLKPYSLLHFKKNDTSTRVLRIATINIEAQTRQKIPPEVLVPSIAVPPRNHDVIILFRIIVFVTIYLYCFIMMCILVFVI